MISVEFLITSLVVVLIPGTGVIYTVSVGLTNNIKNSFAAAIGCTLGIVPHIIASVLGISAIMNMGAQVFFIIKLIGSAYLLYLAWGMLRNTSAFEAIESKNQKSFMQIIIKGIAINLLNPKLTLFFLSFLPQFIKPDWMNINFQMILLSLLFMIMTLIVFVLYGVLANKISSWIKKKNLIMKRIQQCFAAVFAGLAVKLAFTKYSS